jgi:hypothetical protein
MSESTSRPSLTASSVTTLLSNVTAAVRPKPAAAPLSAMVHTASAASAPTAEQKRSGKSQPVHKRPLSLADLACKFTDRFTNHHHGGEVGGAILREAFTLVSPTRIAALRFERAPPRRFFSFFSLSIEFLSVPFLLELCICRVALHPPCSYTPLRCLMGRSATSSKQPSCQWPPPVAASNQQQQGKHVEQSSALCISNLHFGQLFAVSSTLVNP